MAPEDGREYSEKRLELLRTAQCSLEGGVPIEEIRTKAGAEEVEAILGRIAHGIAL